jgi:hypothetical protein
VANFVYTEIYSFLELSSKRNIFSIHLFFFTMMYGLGEMGWAVLICKLL